MNAFDFALLKPRRYAFAANAADGRIPAGRNDRLHQRIPGPTLCFFGVTIVVLAWLVLRR